MRALLARQEAHAGRVHKLMSHIRKSKILLCEAE
jgi:hypothetical protein